MKKFSIILCILSLICFFNSQSMKYNIVIGTDDGKIEILNPNLKKGNLLDTLSQTETGTSYYITSLDVSPDGKSILYTSAQEIVVWDISRKSIIQTFSEKYFTDFSKAKFIPKLKCIYSVDNANTFKTWKLDEKKSKETIKLQGVWPLGIDFSENGKYIAYVHGNNIYGNNIYVFDTKTKKTLEKNLSSNFWSISFHPKICEYFATVCNESTDICHIDPEKNKINQKVRIRKSCNKVSFDSTGERLILAQEKEIFVIPFHKSEGSDYEKKIKFRNRIVDFVSSPNGKELIVGLDNGTICICDINTEKIKKTLRRKNRGGITALEVISTKKPKIAKKRKKRFRTDVIIKTEK